MGGYELVLQQRLGDSDWVEVERHHCPDPGRAAWLVDALRALDEGTRIVIQREATDAALR